MNPKELVTYVRTWGWTRDDLIVAATALLKEATHDTEMVRNNCAICGGDKKIFGKPCGACT